MEFVIVECNGLYRFPALANDRRLRGMKTIKLLAAVKGITEAILISDSGKTRIKLETPVNDNRRFKRGSGAYHCADCRKLTRETGHGESEVGLCLECMHEAELQNLVNDDGWPELEALQEVNPDVKLLVLVKQLDPNWRP